MVSVKEFEESTVYSQIVEAIDWVHYLKKNVDTLIYDPPSDLRLYPNMKAEDKEEWIHQEKKNLAMKHDELTLIRNISVSCRNKLVPMGFSKWSQEGIDAGILKKVGLSDKRSAETYRIIACNREETPSVDASLITTTCSEGDGFIDIETLGNLCPELPDFTFMIGVGIGADKFYCWRTECISLSEERRLVTELLEFVEVHSLRRLLHWAPYEINIFKKLEKRHEMNILSNIQWVDMCEHLSDKTSFFPKGAFSYSLKEIAPAMYKLGMIQCIWSSDCSNGYDAMMNAFEAYRASPDSKKAILDDIQQYNKIDVVATMQIWRYLKSIQIEM